MVDSECDRWGVSTPTCDEVFERLTSGPFPGAAGAARGGAADDSPGLPHSPGAAWSDEATERHLAYCHECRRLAEALRPAVVALRDARDAELLPAYDGALPGDEHSRFLSLRPWLQAADGEAISPSATAPPSQVRLAAMSGLRSWSIVAAFTSALALACVACAAGGLFGSRASDRGGLAVPTSRVHWVASESCRAVREWEAAGGGARSGMARVGTASGGMARTGDSTAASGVIGRTLVGERAECCTQCHAADVEARLRVEPARLLAACLACHAQ